jgi:hypothetical protein
MNSITFDSTIIREKSPDVLEASTYGGPWWDIPHNGFTIQMFHRLLELSWIPITERLPTREEANDFADVEWSDGKQVWEGTFNELHDTATHWKRIVLP